MRDSSILLLISPGKHKPLRGSSSTPAPHAGPKPSSGCSCTYHPVSISIPCCNTVICGTISQPWSHPVSPFNTNMALHRGQDGTQPAGLACAESCRESPNPARSLNLAFHQHTYEHLLNTPPVRSSTHQQQVCHLRDAVTSPTGLHSLKHSCLGPRKTPPF